MELFQYVSELQSSDHAYLDYSGVLGISSKGTIACLTFRPSHYWFDLAEGNLAIPHKYVRRCQIMSFVLVIIFQMKIHGQVLEEIYKDVPQRMLPKEYLPDDYTGPNAGTEKELIGEWCFLTVPGFTTDWLSVVFNTILCQAICT